MKKILDVLLVAIFIPSPIAAALRTNYYGNTCPNLERIVHDVVQLQMDISFKVAPAVLRLFYHDCYSWGCDASVMINNSTGDDELHHPDDTLMNKEGFDTVSMAKKAVDSDPRCTNKVSCADILALAARDSVRLSGGPSWKVELGRYDGKISTKDSVVLPHPDHDLNKLSLLFAKLGLDLKDLIALSGGHTFGVARCEFVKKRLYPKLDPTMDPTFAPIVQTKCPNIESNFTNGTFLDFTTVGTFDNAYYKNLQKGRGVLASDQLLYTDPRSKGMVNWFALNQTAFFEAFSAAMIKLGRVGVKTALDGQIRSDCRFPNSDVWIT